MSDETPMSAEAAYSAFCMEGSPDTLADLFSARSAEDRDRDPQRPYFQDMPTWTHADIADTEAALAKGISEHKGDLRSWGASELQMPYIAARLVEDLREDLALRAEHAEPTNEAANTTLDLVADSVRYRETEQVATGH
jgi:hypothetical protein